MHNPFPANVRIHFTTKAGGASVPPFASNNLGLHVEDNAAHVLQNRQALTEQLAVASIQWLDQVHGNAVVQAQSEPHFPALAQGAEKTHNSIPAADAQFTSERKLACAILTADCLPVLFAAADGSQVAAAHAGWRGLAAGVLLNTLKTFKDPSKVIVCFGAAISQAAFEVGGEVKAAFPWASAACFKAGQGDKHHAHLYQLAFEQLQQAGVTEIYQAVFDGATGEVADDRYQLKRYQTVEPTQFPCTYTQETLFYSYRRDKRTGRMASLIYLA